MWQERLFPELKLIEPQADRRRVLTDADQQAISWTKRIAFIVVAGTIVGAGAGFGFAMISKRWALPNWSVGVCASTACIITCLLGSQIFWRKPLRRHIRRELNRRGIPLCLNCGYILKGLTELRCPECGRPFEPPHRKDSAS